MVQPKGNSLLDLNTHSEPSNLPEKATWWKKSKNVILVLVFLLMSALLGAFVVNTVINGILEDWIGINLRWQRMCMSKECVSAAHELIENMNDQVHPCDDFYDFACSQFVTREWIPDDALEVSQFSLTEDHVHLQLRKIFDEYLPGLSTAPANLTLWHNQACMNVSRIYELGLDPLLDTINEFGGWPIVKQQGELPRFEAESSSLVNLSRALFTQGMGTNFLFSLYVGQDVKKTDEYTLYLDQPDFGLNAKYLNLGRNHSFVQAYRAFSSEIAEFLGAAQDGPRNKAIDEMLTFEMNLSNISASWEERRDKKLLYQNITLRDLSALCPVWDWTFFVNSLKLTPTQLNEDQQIVVIGKPFISQLKPLLAKTKPTTIKNYILWRAIKSWASIIGGKIQAIIGKYHRALVGAKEAKPRWKTCLQATSATFQPLLGKFYVEKFFQNNTSRATASEMISRIKDTFQNNLRKLDWMDKKTKSRALAKLRHMDEFVGFSDLIKNETIIKTFIQGLKLDPQEFFNNQRKINKWRIKQRWMKLGQRYGAIDSLTDETITVVNAYNDLFANSIILPAGILQGAFFDDIRPKYLNYGSLGFIIGHEIIHGYDNIGKQFDEQAKFTTTTLLAKIRSIAGSSTSETLRHLLAVRAKAVI
eukprot:TCALIF_13325-PA protein Name:"Similar to nep-2 Neprilysin-2 (Caenorhabditis elegans)" AED:0.08 eAED:0.08 QI:1/0.12/0/0.77/0.62/0.55/9/0/645